MARRPGRGERVAIVRPAIRLPREAEAEMASLSAPATPALPRTTEVVINKKVPKSVASMVRR